MSGASDQANGRASGPVLQSVFLIILDHRDKMAEMGTTGTNLGSDRASKKKVARTEMGGDERRNS